MLGEQDLHVVEGTRARKGRRLRVLASLLGTVIGTVVGLASAHAQGITGAQPFSGRSIDTITIRITNPSADSAFNARVEDSVRRALGLFPGATYSEERITFALGAARRNAAIDDLTYDPLPSATGGVDLTVTVTLREGAQPAEGRGMAVTGRAADFPLLLDRNGTYIKFRLDALSLYYANNNAWYGRPDLMLAGNPLAQGEPAGRGYDDWVEGYVHYGVSGIAPLGERLYAYAALSGMTTGSYGQELFTDETRTYTDVEDAYVGLVGGNVDEAGNRLTFNASAGRQRFTLANGFLIVNTAANGEERAALQANARWANDLLVLGQVAYNEYKFEAFYVDPDELPLLDSKTVYAGVNFETKPLAGLMLAATYLTVPESEAGYFGPTGTVIGGRDGLRVYDARFTYEPRPTGAGGPFFGGEYARQSNREFAMDARAGWLEAGYHFTQARWSPTVSYRISYFSGDDPATSTYERWDPLLSGGSGEQWVQGANHYKVVQDGNVIAHRLQGRLRLAPRVEIVPQLWAFKADELNNIGGNPALSFLSDDELGYEAIVTVKWFKSRNTYVHGQIAYTRPGQAVEDALEGTQEDWLSVAAFIRYSF